MASRLYKIKGVSTREDVSIHPPRLLNIVEFFIDLIPEFLRRRCCKKTRTMRAIEKARERLSKEINILDIVKSRRLIQSAMKLLLSKEKLD